MAKEKVNLKERAESLLESIKMAESIQDYDYLSTNLNVIKELLYMSDHQKDVKKVKILEDIPAATRAKLTRTMRRLKSDIAAEQARRKEIQGYGEKYDVLKDQLEKYDTVQIEFSSALNRMPGKERFVYESRFELFTDENIQNLSNNPRYANTAIMIDYFNSVAESLGIEKSDLVGKSFADIEQMIETKGKDLDELAFKIDKANGVYNIKMVEKDAIPVNQYILQQELKSKFPDLYNEAFVGETRTKEQILDDAITSTRAGSDINKALREIKAIGSFDDLLSSVPQDVKDNFLMDDDKISRTDLDAELMRLSGGNPISSLTSPNKEICEALEKMQKYEDSKAKIKTNKKLYESVFSGPKGPAGKASIDAKIAELKGLPQTKARKSQIEFLQGITEFNIIDRSELDNLYQKYDVDPTKPVTDLQKAIGDISKLEHENETIDNVSYGDFSAENLKSVVNTSHLDKDNPVQRLEGALFNINNDSPKNISDYVTLLAQTEGYSPTVGKESFVYARPIYSGRIFKKLEKVEIVEESIASIAANPLKAYQAALADYNEKLSSLGMTPLNRKEKEEMDAIVANMIKESKNPNTTDEMSAKYMDEVMKRIISLKSCNTRTDLLRAKDEHSRAYDPKADPKHNYSVTFPGDHYNAPQVKYAEKEGKFLFFKTKSRQIEVDVDTPATSATQEKSEHARNFFGEERLSNNTTITREQMQLEAQRRARDARDAMRRRARDARDAYDRDDD